MKIEQDVNINANQTTDYAGLKEAPARLRNLSELSAGDIFKATVTDIQPNQVSLRLATGGELTAKSLVLPDARIGDDTLFAIKENNKGQILLEMIRPDGDTLKENIAREALISANIYPNGENLSLAKALMDNNLPIDANSLQKAAFFHYSAVNMPIEQILFLMKENFTMDAVNIDTLEKLMEQGGFSQKLTDAAELFSQLDDSLKGQVLEKLLPVFELTSPEFAESVKNTLSSVANGGKTDIRELMLKAKHFLSLTLKGKNSLDKLDEYFSRLHKALSEIEKLPSPSGDKNNFIEKASDLKQQLEFMDHIGNYKEYMQIPINLEGRLNNAELFIFKEPRKKRNLSERASVLIAMDYINLGRVEVFIDKVEKNINFQFHSDKHESLKQLSSGFNELGKRLLEAGYKITGVSFKNIDECFTVLKTIETSESKAAEKKRYSFDMRV